MTRKGFTLIELLVVIAIIAILAAILFPVFATAREKARQVSCLSNIKQLTLAWIMYSQDYDENFPQWKWDISYRDGTGAGDAKNNATTLWHNAIFPYVKNVQAYTCPSDGRNLDTRRNYSGWFDMNTVLGFPTALFNVPISYGANEPLTYNFPAIGAMDKPAETLLIGDCTTTLTGWESYGEWVAAENEGAPANDPRRFYRIKRVAFPKGDACMGDDMWNGQADNGPYKASWDNCALHLGGENLGYADGHAKYSRARAIVGSLYGVK